MPCVHKKSLQKLELESSKKYNNKGKEINQVGCSNIPSGPYLNDLVKRLENVYSKRKRLFISFN